MYAFTAALVADTDPNNGGGVSSTVQGIANTHDQIILALIAVVATSVAALVYVIKNGRDIREGATAAKAANAAVNNVGPNKDNLYRMVEDIREDVQVLMTHKAGWDHLPTDLSDAVNVTSTIRSIQHADKETDRKLDVIIEELRGHIDWEMAEKYGKHGGALTGQMPGPLDNL